MGSVLTPLDLGLLTLAAILLGALLALGLAVLWECSKGLGRACCVEVQVSTLTPAPEPPDEREALRAILDELEVQLGQTGGERARLYAGGHRVSVERQGRDWLLSLDGRISRHPDLADLLARLPIRLGMELPSRLAAGAP